MHGNLIQVTPEMAEHWLASRNHHNRPLRPGVVRRYSDAMTRGEWRPHHQGIAFAGDWLVDGQHRLAVIVRSGVTVELMVTHGVPLASQIAVDDHLRRTPHDAIALMVGMHDITKHHTAIARAIMRTGSGDQMKRDSANKVALHDFLSVHRDAINFGVDCMLSRGHKRVLSYTVIYAVMSRAWYTAPVARLIAFREVFQTGEPVIAAEDVAAITLRNWLFARSPLHAGEGLRLEVYRRVTRMLVAFLNREPMRRCLATPKHFPLPSASNGPK